MSDLGNITLKTSSIRHISIENFKAFAKLQHIPIRPITLIFGANSSGKSSILHSLLFLNQIQLESYKPHANVTFTDLGGNIVDLGGFPNVAYKHNKNNTLRFSIGANLSQQSSLGNQLQPMYFSTEITFDKSGNIDTATYFFNKKKLVSLINLSKRNNITAYFDTEVKPETKVVFHNIQQLCDLDNDESFGQLIELIEKRIRYRQLQSRTDFSAIMREIFALIANTKITADIQASFVADRVLKDTSIPMLRMRQLARINGFVMNEDDLLKSIQREIKRSGGEIIVTKEHSIRIYDFLAIVAEICLTLSGNMLMQIQEALYIGPLRKIPSRNFNELHERNQEHSTGLIAWRALSRNKNTTELVNSWMKKLGIKYRIISEQVYARAQLDQILLKKNQSSGITTSDIDNLSPRDSHLRFEDLTNKTSVSHRDLGIGVSQVLPIIVNAINLKSKMILIEQPELHLHPRLQAELAELFIETATHKSKQQNTYILETHSEHIILRILRRIREGKLSPQDVSILYVSPDRTGNLITHIEVDSDGDFLDHWPEGFFEESYRERMAGR